MDLRVVHHLAKVMTYSDFLTEIRYRIDKILPTVKADSEYVVVNKNDLLHNVINNEVSVCPKCGCNKLYHGKQVVLCNNVRCDWQTDL